MALVAYTITALERDTADATVSGKQVVVGAVCSLYSQPADTVVTIYDDAAGTNGSTAKTTGANGQVVIYAEQGRYRLNVNGVDSFITVASDVPVEADTFAALQASRPVQTGQRFICRERDDANYILQAGGYTALPGDVTFANGRVAALQVTAHGIDVKAFGAAFDTALPLAVDRCAGVCDILVSDEYTTGGLEFSSVSNVSMRFSDGGKITLSDGADAHLLSFTGSTNITILSPIVDGNRLNQTVSSGGSAFNGLHFEQCSDVEIKGGLIENVAASGIRGRNCSDMTVDGVELENCGFRQIYIAPSTTGGVDCANVTVSNCVVRWDTMADSALTNSPAISVTNNGTSEFDMVSVVGNRVYQHPDSVTDSISIEAGGVKNLIITGNITRAGQLGISWYNCDTFSVDGNSVDTTGSFGIECANRNMNGTISSNAVNGGGDLVSAIGINGALGICENISISGNAIENVVNGITAFGQSLAVRHKNISMTGNTIFCAGGGRPINLQWVDGLSISGGLLDGNSLSSSIIQLTECNQFSIVGTKQRNIQNFCVNIFSFDEVTISNSFVGSNDFDNVPGNQQLNYVRNSLAAGSTFASLVVRGNSRGPDFINYGSNVLSWSGTGTPEGSITAGVGSQFIRTDGGAGTTFYIKETGTGNTGWAAK